MRSCLSRTLLVVFAQAVSTVVLPAQPAAGTMVKVTLTEARRRAAAVAPDAVASRGDVTTAEWERRRARTDLLTPTLTAGSVYTHFSEPFFNFGTGRISPNTTNATLQANYALWGAGKFAELRRTRASVTSAEANDLATRFRVALATDAAYYAVLAASELSRVAADRLQRAREAFGVARVRVQAGDAIATDSLQLLLEVNRARLDVLRRDSALAVSRLRLGRQVGLADPVDATAIDSAAPPALPMSEGEAVTEMRSKGPEVEAFRAAERRADAAISVEREGYFPDISLGASTGAYDAQFFPSALHRSQVSITLSWSIWDGGQRELSVARARVQRDIARANRIDRERATGEMMAESYQGYQTARAGIDLAQVGVAVARETFRVQRARYREGATTILDLLEAQVALSAAEAELVQSRYAARLALAQIEALLGRRIFETENTNSTER